MKLSTFGEDGEDNKLVPISANFRIKRKWIKIPSLQPTSDSIGHKTILRYCPFKGLSALLTGFSYFLVSSKAPEQLNKWCILSE
jgi:hypothetical protein